MSFPVPDACTLPTVEQPIRQAEFQDLLSTVLRARERRSPRHLRLTFAGGEDLADTVRDLARRETECCAFFDFTVTADAGDVVLDIEVPAAHADVLDGLSGLASASSHR